MIAPLVISLVVGYLLGALPFGYFVARSHGVNIFEVGSKNPGATNVRRVLGAKAGNTVFVLDALKGSLAALWPLAGPWLHLDPHAVGSMQIMGLVGALVGHSFSCFTGFKGGKGVATAVGALVVIMPISALSCAAVWIVVFYASRYVSLASVVGAASLPLVTAFAYGRYRLILATGLALFVIIRHRANIARLMNGTESRFEKRKSGAQPS